MILEKLVSSLFDQRFSGVRKLANHFFFNLSLILQLSPIITNAQGSIKFTIKRISLYLEFGYSRYNEILDYYKRMGIKARRMFRLGLLII